MTQTPCEKIAVFPQRPEFRTCWLNALIMMIFYSQHARTMVLQNEDKWSKMSAQTKNVFKMMLSKARSDDHAFFKTVNPKVLMEFLHKESPTTFYMHTMAGEWDALYLPRLFDFLGVRRSLHFKARQKRNDLVDLYLFTDHDDFIGLQSPGGRVAFELRKNVFRVLYERLRRVLVVDSIQTYDYFTIRFEWTLPALPGKPILSDVPYSFLINNEFTLGETKYVLDSVFYSNVNRNDKEGPGCHAIAGITCNNTKYLYNGWSPSTGNPFPLFKFDWGKDTTCLSPNCPFNTKTKSEAFSKCSSVKNQLKYHSNAGMRTYVFINKQYVQTQNVPKDTPPRPTLTSRPKDRRCPSGMVMNPATNRCVKVDGKIGRKLIAEQRKRSRKSIS